MRTKIMDMSKILFTTPVKNKYQTIRKLLHAMIEIFCMRNLLRKSFQLLFRTGI
jgi:hypothetical protein